MAPNTTSIDQQLQDLKNDPDALDQSLALTRIVISMLKSKQKEDLWLRILLAVSLLCNVAIAGMFLAYESQFTTNTTTETVTVEQDTGEGQGNNVYQAGESATYVQEGVNNDGETNGNSYQNNPDSHQNQEQ